MTLNQLQTYVVGVLQGWITNKSILDKFSETADGKLLYDGVEVGSGSGEVVTDAEVTQAIVDTLTELGLEISAEVATLAELQSAIANQATKIQITEAFNITDDVTLTADTLVTISTDVADVFTVAETGVLTLGKNITVNATDSILWANGGTVNIEGANLVSSLKHTLGFAENGGTINVNSGSVIGTTNNRVTLDVAGSGSINITGGLVTSKASSVIAVRDGATVTMDGGTVETTASEALAAIYTEGDGSNITINGGIVKASNEAAVDINDGGSAIITSGEFVGGNDCSAITASGTGTVSISGGTFSSEIDNAYLAEGYVATEVDGVWTVTEENA